MQLKTLLLLLLVTIAICTRTFDIRESAEFLGDQGRSGIVAVQALKTKTLPLTGPTTLRNQYLGPFFYYISILTFGIGKLNPIVPSVFMAAVGVLSVVILFFTMDTVLGLFPATIATLLWAVSPQIVRADKIFWEPNLIPFFSLLFLFFLIRIIKWNRTRDWIFLGVDIGILLQLHYFSLFFLWLMVLFILFLFRNGKYSRKKVGIHMGVTIFSLIAVLSPLLLYESKHNWTDIVSIGEIIFSHSQTFHARLFLSDALDYGGRMIGYFLPFGGNIMTREKTQVFLFVMMIITGILFLFRRKERQEALTLGIFHLIWFGTGIAAVAMYHDVVFDHYLLFLLPSVIFLIGMGIFLVRSRWIQMIIAVFAVLLAAYQLKIIFQAPKLHDIERIEELTDAVDHQIDHNPFSFTLYGTQSFSDLHYRFSLLRRNLVPQPATASTYRTFIVICEYGFCPDELPTQLPILCYDMHCSGNYGTFDLTKWHVLSTYRSASGTVYTYTRLSN